MANDATRTVAAINAAAAAMSSAEARHATPPPEQRRWKSFWSRLWCFRSQKRGKRIAPALRLDGSTGSSRGWAATGPAQIGLALAPPSSPASFVNSSVQSPASFNLSLSAAANACSPSLTNPMFMIGPYAYETQIVTPPVFSTFTTEPSTAPFTPPELAHAATLSSPEVPFAQLLASSLEAKSSTRDTVSPFSASPVVSSREVSMGHLQGTYFFFPGSPVCHLVSPTSGISGSGSSSPIPDIEFPAQSKASVFPRSEPLTTSNFAQTTSNFVQRTSTTLNLPENLGVEPSQNLQSCEANSLRSQRESKLDSTIQATDTAEVGTNVSQLESQNYHTFFDCIHHVTKENNLRNGEGQEKSMGDEKVVQANGNIFYLEARKKDSGKFSNTENFHPHLNEVAHVKKETAGSENSIQHADGVVEGDQRHFVAGIPGLTVGMCSDLETMENTSQAQVAGIASAQDSFSTNQIPGEIIGHICKDFQDSLGYSEAVNRISLDGICSLSNVQSQQESLDEKIWNSTKHCVHNAEGMGCKRCGELAVRCDELSAALEQAKERLAIYEVKGKASVSPNRNKKHFTQGMHQRVNT